MCKQFSGSPRASLVLNSIDVVNRLTNENAPANYSGIEKKQGPRSLDIGLPGWGRGGGVSVKEIGRQGNILRIRSTRARLDTVAPCVGAEGGVEERNGEREQLRRLRGLYPEGFAGYCCTYDPRNSATGCGDTEFVFLVPSTLHTFLTHSNRRGHTEGKEFSIILPIWCLPSISSDRHQVVPFLRKTTLVKSCP